MLHNYLHAILSSTLKKNSDLVCDMAAEVQYYGVVPSVRLESDSIGLLCKYSI